MLGLMRQRAGVIVIRNEAVALIERRRAGPRYWVVPGGGVEPGESIEEAAAREAAEELGVEVDIRALRVQLSAPYSNGVPGHHWYFEASSPTDEIRVVGPELGEGDAAGTYEAVWIAIDEVPSLDVFPVEIADLISRYRDGDWPVDLVIHNGEPF
jgi:8-oxo-dGTP diphosphatase